MPTSSEAEAIAKLLDGGADAIDNSHEYLEVAEDCGLSADEHQELAAELRDLGVPVDEIILSIRSIEQKTFFGKQRPRCKTFYFHFDEASFGPPFCMPPSPPTTMTTFFLFDNFFHTRREVKNQYKKGTPKNTAAKKFSGP
jgi:hypothetical protein